MVDDPLEAVYAFVERAYVRLQAGEMLIYCLDQGDTAPILSLVEELVLAGPQSIGVSREVLAEIGSRKAQLQDDLQQVYTDLDTRLKEYGLSLIRHYNPSTLVTLSHKEYLALLIRHGVLLESRQVECMQLFDLSQETMCTLMKHLQLLDEVESTLHDWLWTLIYQSAHLDWSPSAFLKAKAPKNWVL